MVIEVKIFGYLKRYCQKNDSKRLLLEIPEGTNICNLFDIVGIPKNEHVIVSINDKYFHNYKDIKLKNSDKILICPTISGG